VPNRGYRRESITYLQIGCLDEPVHFEECSRDNCLLAAFLSHLALATDVFEFCQGVFWKLKMKHSGVYQAKRPVFFAVAAFSRGIAHTTDGSFTVPAKF
jgi:hypothetical protein